MSTLILEEIYIKFYLQRLKMLSINDKKKHKIMFGSEFKRTNGQYFTMFNPFNNQGFKEWAFKVGLPNMKILEPFAGSNNLIEMLKQMELCKEFSSFDINPENAEVLKQDTILNFPKGYDVCITNPPYLARNSAKRRGLFFPECKFDDLYKLALEKCLENCQNVGAIIPASFLNSGLFRDRLSYYILLNNKMFNDTSHPVCLALFDKNAKDTFIYNDNTFIDTLSNLEKKLPKSTKQCEMKFNKRDGKLGLIAIDNTIEPSIEFCDGEKINPDKICISSRSITRIEIESDIPKLIKKLNKVLKEFRYDTDDIFLTPFKGLRKDNKYRRRLDFALAREIINFAI